MIAVMSFMSRSPTLSFSTEGSVCAGRASLVQPPDECHRDRHMTPVYACSKTRARQDEKDPWSGEAPKGAPTQDHLGEGASIAQQKCRLQCFRRHSCRARDRVHVHPLGSTVVVRHKRRADRAVRHGPRNGRSLVAAADVT